MDPPTLVLIVEDEDDDAGLIQRRLRITGILNRGWVWRGGEEGTTFWKVPVNTTMAIPVAHNHPADLKLAARKGVRGFAAFKISFQAGEQLVEADVALMHRH